jgi:hypothetical protein
LVGCWLGDQTTTTEKMNSSKPQWEQVGEAFVQHYYNTFDSSRSNLGPLYRENSMLTFEGEKYLGVQQIVGKLTALPFQKVQHQIVTCDCQPTQTQPSGILVFVNGNLLVDDSQNPLKFSQCFYLLPDSNNPASYWVHNDMFRLNYG